MAGRRVKGRDKRVGIGLEELKSRGEEQRLVKGKGRKDWNAKRRGGNKKQMREGDANRTYFY